MSCWRPVGARTDRKLELIRECAWRLVALATLTLLDLNAQRTRERTRARQSTFSFAHNARACHSHRTPPHSAYKATSPGPTATRAEVSGQAKGTERQPRLARGGKSTCSGAFVVSKDTECATIWRPCRSEKVRVGRIRSLDQAVGSCNAVGGRPARNWAVSGAKILDFRSKCGLFAPVHGNLRHDSGREG